MTDITPLIPKGRQIISSYGNGGFTITGERYDCPVIVMPEKTLIWNLALPQDMQEADFTQIIENKEKIEILLVGTGLKTVILPNNVIRFLKSNGISVDMMDTGAACRTYNVLLSEERKVAAAIVAI